MAGAWTWPCQDCGARIAVPVDVNAIAAAISAGRRPPPLDEDALRGSIIRHVMWNPDLHPSLIQYRSSES